MINLFNKQELLNGINYLSSNYPIMQKLYRQYGTPNLDRGSKDIFLSLIRSIISQQISTQAALSVHKKFQTLFSENIITPDAILSEDEVNLKSAGLSKQKIEYIRSTSQFFIETKYTNEDLSSMNDSDLKKQLISIKGVGPWTIDMILIFSLGRPDIFPVGDLAIRKGFNILYGKEHTEKQMINESKNWKPYRTIFSWYLWRVIDGTWESL